MGSVGDLDSYPEECKGIIPRVRQSRTHAITRTYPTCHATGHTEGFLRVAVASAMDAHVLALGSPDTLSIPTLCLSSNPLPAGRSDPDPAAAACGAGDPGHLRVRGAAEAAPGRGGRGGRACRPGLLLPQGRWKRYGGRLGQTFRWIGRHHFRLSEGYGRARSRVG